MAKSGYGDHLELKATLHMVKYLNCNNSEIHKLTRMSLYKCGLDFTVNKIVKNLISKEYIGYL